MKSIYEWQGLIGAIIGASTPFILWWCAETYRYYRERKDRLYYVHRIIVDQINGITEVRKTILNFVSKQLNILIDSPRTETENQYSVDLSFFPLFSAKPLSDDLHHHGTGSTYVDNKLAQAYKISQDLPFIVEDLRRQFQETLGYNKEIAFNKLNAPVPQRDAYRAHLQKYRTVLQEEMLDHNIPTFLKVLTETLVPIIKLREIGIVRWRLKFEAHFKFFKNRKDFKRYQGRTYNRIEDSFEQEVRRQLDIFSNSD